MAEEEIQRAVNEAKTLIELLERTSVRRISLAAGQFKIEIEREFASAGTAAKVAPAAAMPTAPADSRHRVLSPMVGVFYHAPSPGAKPLVEVGARVERGQAIGIIEAMKVMNEVASDATGIVAEILVADGQPVEFEQPLIVIDIKT